MSVTEQIRDLSKLQPEAELACRLLFQEAYKAGIKDIFITETLRTQARQNYIFEQGRTRKYNAKGERIYPVTWTLKSNHASGLAFDVAVAPPKALYHASTLTALGIIAAKLGITWGGQASWVRAGKTDRPHFEVKRGWKPPAGYKLEGQVIVPSNSKLRVQLIVKDKGDTIMSKKGFDAGSSSGNSAIENRIAQAVKEGLIDKSHLADFQNGVMTSDRVVGLLVIIEDRRAVRAAEAAAKAATNLKGAK